MMPDFGRSKVHFHVDGDSQSACDGAWRLRRRGGGAVPGVLLAAILLAGCELLSPGSSSESTQTVLSDGETVEIEEGSAVRLGADGPFLYFASVVDDSRCPIGLMCFWEGRASVEFQLAAPGRDTRDFVATIPGLVPNPYEANEEILADGFVVKLLALDPYPNEDNPAPPQPYRAVLMIGNAPE